MRRLIPVWMLAIVWCLSIQAEVNSVDLGDLRKGLSEVGEKLLQISSKLPPDDITKGGISLPKKVELSDAEKALTIDKGEVKELGPKAELVTKKTIKKPVFKSKKRVVKKAATAADVVPAGTAPTDAVPVEIAQMEAIPLGTAPVETVPVNTAPTTVAAEKKEKKSEDVVASKPAETPKDGHAEQDIKGEKKEESVKKPATKKVIGTVEMGLKAQDIDDERIRNKMKRAEKMVNDAIVFLKKNSIGNACRSFEQDPEWRAGDLYITIFNDFGALMLDGPFTQRLWDDFLVPTRDELTGLIVHDSFVSKMLELGQNGGWISYDWDFGIRFSFAKTVKKNGLTLVVAVGFYPDSPRFAIQQLVKKAIRYGERSGAHQMFEQINNPRGVFVRGDLYLWAYDFDGFAYAHGHNIVYVGQDRKAWKDTTGFQRNKKMIEMVQVDGKGWIDYTEDGLPKTAYFEAFVDPRSGRRYIVGGGYYPTINDDMVVNFVKRGINYLKANGADVAFRDFSSYAGKFVQGPLRLFAYDLEGTMLADSENPIFIGQNLIHTKDAEGSNVVVKILGAVKNDAGSGWVTFKDKGAYRSLYVEYVEVPDGKFIVGAGYWPASKDYTARSIAEKAVGALKTLDISEALRNFLTLSNDWIRGDLYVRVYSVDGICLASGPDRGRIWHDEKKHLDEKGYPVFKEILAIARGGGGVAEYPMYGYPYRAYVDLVEKPVPVEAAEARAAERKEKLKQENKRSKLKIVGTAEDEVSDLMEQYVISVGYYL
jgi:hypothetical protein